MVWFLLAIVAYLYLAGAAMAWLSLVEEKVSVEDPWELGLAAGLVVFWPLASGVALVVKAYFWARGGADEFD